DLTWECVKSSFSSELAPDLTSGYEDAVRALLHITLTPCTCQSADYQLSQELKRVKKELERVKADKTAQCEAYQQTISSLQAQLRAA
ncbi:hypothetical protein N310_01016, partial [Acanthisitta chloris]